jgi:chromosome partitioning protein
MLDFVLALPDDGAVSEPNDLVARANSIFERLRGSQDRSRESDAPAQGDVASRREGGDAEPGGPPPGTGEGSAAPIDGSADPAGPAGSIESPADPVRSTEAPAEAPAPATLSTLDAGPPPDPGSDAGGPLAPAPSASPLAGLSQIGATPGPGPTVDAGTEVGGPGPPPGPAEASETSEASAASGATSGLAGSDGPTLPLSRPGGNGQPTGADLRHHAAAGPHPAAAARPLPRRLAIANQKGGVGKTTTAVNLGAALAELDYRVLVVDLDPQGNATTGLGINGRNLDASIYDVILHDVPIEDVIEATILRNLFVVPATIDLAGAEIELVPVFSRELRLRRALETIDGDFDFILIDCPPSLGLLTVNGLAAAGEVVVPIQCEYYALEGLGQLLRNVGLVQTNLNHELEVSTIIMTMYDARTRLAEQVVDEVRVHFGDRVCRNVVPRTVRLSEAPSFGQPIILFDSSSRGAIAYRELAKEVSGGAPQRVR